MIRWIGWDIQQKQEFIHSPAKLGVTALGQVVDVQYLCLQLANIDKTYVCLIQDHDVTGKFGELDIKGDQGQNPSGTEGFERFSFFS